MGTCCSTKNKQEKTMTNGDKNKQSTSDSNTKSNPKKETSNQQIEPEDKKPKYTIDKYGKKVPVLSNVGDSNMMIRRNNSKENIENP